MTESRTPRGLSRAGQRLVKAAMERYREVYATYGTKEMLHSALTPKARALIKACIAFDKAAK